MHSKYRFSITLHTDDLAVVNCLRALSQYSQRRGNNRIPWGGTKDEDWLRDSHEVTFRFTSPDYRMSFLAEATRLLPKDLWQVRGQSDEDPAQRQRRTIKRGA